MNIHQNARLTLRGRADAVRRVTELGESARQVARVRQTTDGTVRKWVARAAAGERLTDRSSRPQHSPHATPPALVLRIRVLRQQARPVGAMRGDRLLQQRARAVQPVGIGQLRQRELQVRPLISGRQMVPAERVGMRGRRELHRPAFLGHRL